MKYFLPLFGIIVIHIMLLTLSCKSSQSQQDGNAANSFSIQHEIPGWESALTPKGVKGPEILLVNKGQSKYRIMIPDQPRPQDQTAGRELQKWLQAMTGVAIPVLKEKQIPKGSPFISLGKTKAFSKAITKLPDLGDEGYLIEAKQIDKGLKVLFLAGGQRRGPINAVLALLEEDLGCRWYSRDEDAYLIPHYDELRFRPVNRHEKPAFETRELYMWTGLKPAFVQRNRLHPSRVRTPMPDEWGGGKHYPRGWKLHTFRKVVDAPTYHKSHPEYYSELNGRRIAPKNGVGTQLCLMNPDVNNIAKKKVRQILNENPGYSLIHVSQNDGGGLSCSCAACNAKNVQEDAASGSLVKFINEVAADVATYRPDVEVVTFAYKETAKPPKTEKPGANVIIELASDIHRPYKYLPVRSANTFSGYIQGWRKANARLFIWDYPIALKNYLLPVPNMGAVADNLKYYQEQGIEGVVIQGAFQSKTIAADRGYLRAWVWSKLLWNPTLDVKALIRDFTYGYYKAAGPAMMEYHNYLWSLWEKQLKDPVQDDIMRPFPKDFYAQAKPMFEKALLATQNPEIRKRIEIAQIAPLYARTNPGPHNTADIPSYRKDMEAFFAMCDKHAVTRLNAHNSEVNLDAFRQSCEIRINNVGVKVRKGTIMVQEESFSIPFVWEEAEKPVVIKDAKANNGYALKLDGKIDLFRMIYKVQTDRILPGHRYRVKVALRAEKTNKPARKDKKNQEVPAALVEIYSPPTKEHLCDIRIRNQELTHKEYRLFTIGEFNGAEKLQFKLRATNNGKIGAIYLDYVSFERID